MDNKERAVFIAKEYTVEDLILKISEASGQMKKAANYMSDYLGKTANVTGKDARLGALSKVFVAETGSVAALIELLDETFLGSGLAVEKELASGRMFEETVANLKAQKAARDKNFFEAQAKQYADNK